MRHRAACLLFVLGGFAAQTSTLPELRTAAATMTPGNLLRHIRELSSDAYEGRLPGTPGEDKSVAYVLSQIKAIGLQPGTPTGGFVQKVPLYGIRSRGTTILCSLASTVANINLDYFSNWGWGRTRDFSIVGIGNSTLDDLTAEAVQRQGRILTGDTAPEMGFYFRSDHYEFARVGVPSLETSPGIDYMGNLLALEKRNALTILPTTITTNRT